MARYHHEPYCFYMEKEKICKKHGVTVHILDSQNYLRCKKCRVENVYKYRKNLKLKLINYYGGKCILCNYNKCYQALEFHHIDESQKSFDISDKSHYSFSQLKNEIDKCVLLCSNCHREVEYKITSLDNIRPLSLKGEAPVL